MRKLFAFLVVVFSLFMAQAFAQNPVQQRPIPGDKPGPMAAESVMGDYTARVLGQGLWIGILVTLLLGGGMLVLNLGLLSKREEDRVGHRDPSDVGILRTTITPNDPASRSVLPAEDEDLEALAEQQEIRTFGYSAVTPLFPERLAGDVNPERESVSDVMEPGESSVLNTGTPLKKTVRPAA